MSLTLNTKLGHYEIVSPIGAGGMGEVYRARDTRLDHDVAITVLPDSMTRNADRIARLERYAKVLAFLIIPTSVQSRVSKRPKPEYSPFSMRR